MRQRPAVRFLWDALAAALVIGALYGVVDWCIEGGLHNGWALLLAVPASSLAAAGLAWLFRLLFFHDARR